MHLLPLWQEDVHVAPAIFPWLSRPMLHDMREGSGCAALRTPQEAPHTVRLVGTRKQVRADSLSLSLPPLPPFLSLSVYMCGGSGVCACMSSPTPFPTYMH